MSTNALIVMEEIPAAAQSGVARRLVRHLSDLLIRAVVAGLEYRLRRKTYVALSALDDRLLADVGLNRSEVRSIVHACVAERTRLRCAMV